MVKLDPTSTRGARAQAVKANVVGYLIKPFAAAELLACVGRALKSRHVGSE
jgi:DNA-binding response OmpR family regulator